MRAAARGFSKMTGTIRRIAPSARDKPGLPAFFDAKKALDRKTFLWYCKFFI
jgi:hypothetical protein